ncbi:MAG: PspC domain-containing protein, partial [Candidatus Aminicenantes bacterium]|nr:PspC domain-containing protein [Candidatus Aminicenantes bacterium]
MKRLYRSRKDKMIAGVCGGVSEYFNIDPVIIRVITIILTLWGGSGIIAYIIAMIIIPQSPENADESVKKPSKSEASLK